MLPRIAYDRQLAPGHDLPYVARWLVLFLIATSVWITVTPRLHAQERVLVEARESLYNNIYVYREGNYLSMTFGHNNRRFVESIFNTANDRELPSPYTRYMTAALAYPGAIDTVLEIGLGGGRTSWYIHKHMPEAELTVVELDPEVIVLAKKYFGIREGNRFRIVARDGRMHLARNTETYSAIFIDAYRGPFVPFHLLTAEFYRLVKSRLKLGGVVAQNIEPNTMLFDAAVVTIRSVFENVDLFDADGSVVAIAYDGPRQSDAKLRQKALRRQRQYHFFYGLPALLDRRKPAARLPDTKPLTDDFAPVEYLNAIERYNRKWK
jgi:spermidine synthase